MAQTSVAQPGDLRIAVCCTSPFSRLPRPPLSHLDGPREPLASQKHRPKTLTTGARFRALYMLPSPAAPAARLTVYSFWIHLFSEPSNGLNFLLLLLVIFNPAFQVFRIDYFVIGLCYHVARTRILCMQPPLSPQGNRSKTPHNTKIREAQVYVKWYSLCI